MIDREVIESRIRDVVASETGAAALSEKLFSPTGLFNALAAVETNRDALVRSDLFKQAQARFRQLQQREAAAFSQAVEQAEASLPGGIHRLKWECVELQ
jgi:hypothetical protein